MEIRDAALEELDYIRMQRVQAYQEYEEVLPHGHFAALTQAISSSGDMGPDVEVIVAKVDGRIAGSVVLFPPNTDAYDGYLEELDYPEIRMLAVDPAFRGNGIAYALVQECIRRFVEKGHTSIGLHTGEFMKNAMKLYEKVGFERLPQYDFEPANDGIIVKAYRLGLHEGTAAKVISGQQGDKWIFARRSMYGDTQPPGRLSNRISERSRRSIFNRIRCQNCA